MQTSTRPRHFLSAMLALLAVALPTTAAAGTTGTLTFVSGPTWNVFSADPGPAAAGQGEGIGFIGHAQAVCLNEFAPAPCADGALLYGFPEPGWPADISAIPGAAWSWAPGVTGSSSPAELATFYFSKGFVIAGTPTAGTLYLAADDYAQLQVNGVTVGSIGSVTDIGLAANAQSLLTPFDISSYLKPGYNHVTIIGRNGPTYYSSFCGQTCTYAQNPAGVVFGGSIAFTQDS
jgi:hypothetical protein